MKTHATPPIRVGRQPGDAHREDVLAEIEMMARFAKTLDSAFRIPFTRIEFGLDALLGLVPAVGDLLTAFMALSIVYRGWRLGASAPTVIAMLGNVAVDFFAGVVPLAGDVVDVFWKGNQRNIELLRREFGAPASADDTQR